MKLTAIAAAALLALGLAACSKEAPKPAAAPAAEAPAPATEAPKAEGEAPKTDAAAPAAPAAAEGDKK
jgi:PBP1b-binding outer membrane lipoprotein LpoB